MLETNKPLFIVLYKTESQQWPELCLKFKKNVMNLCNSGFTENCPSNPDANLEERMQHDVCFIAVSYTTHGPNSPFVVHAVELYSQTEAK